MLKEILILLAILFVVFHMSREVQFVSVDNRFPQYILSPYSMAGETGCNERLMRGPCHGGFY